MPGATLRLLRIPFSFFLMPVYFFAVSQVPAPVLWKMLLIFAILHLLIYPASNGYNSYMDRDEQSIGLLEHPPLPTRRLFWVTLLLDLAGLLLSALVSWLFFACILGNILASRAYSYRGIRLKKYPVTGFFTVIIFQGAVTFFMVYAGSGGPVRSAIPWAAIISSSLLFGCFYPLTQIYQHAQDFRDHVISISYRLGYEGTFKFTAAMFLTGDALMYVTFSQQGKSVQFLWLQLCLLPVVVYFISWFLKVRNDSARADYRHSMRMNLLAAVCANAAFILIFILNHT
jgi:1,4-dihydroxy-2-naphthoate octaprenyltransferase